MFSLQSIGKLTGWKAVLVATVFFTVVGFQAWETMPHYHKIDSGVWNIPSGEGWAYTFNLSEQGKIEFEITRSAPDEFQVVLIEAAGFDRVMAGSTPPPAKDNSGTETEQIAFLFDQTGSGTIAGRNIQLDAGRYKIITTHTDPSDMTANYKIFEYRGAK